MFKGDEIMVEKLKQDMIEAMKNKEKERLTVIRMVKAAMDQEHIDRKREINDELLIDVVNKQIKMRKDSITEFEKGNRNDLIEKTESEIKLLEEYMPEQLSTEEVINVIDKVFDEVKPTGMSDMGKIMGKLNPLLKGKADMGLVSSIVKEKISAL